MADRSTPALVLASASPRRAQLLAFLGVDVAVVPADIDERRVGNETPEAYVERLAVAKAAAVASAHPDDAVIGADTTVALDDEVFGKPVDAADATRTLRRLSGRTHRVLTGVAVSCGGRVGSGVDATEVTFAPLVAEDIDWYVATGEPFGKAGAYAVQGAGGILVAELHGNLHTVVGLPLRILRDLLADVGVELIPRR